MFEFMDTETDVIDRDDVKLPDDIHPDISFEDVSFSYDSDKGNALKNFTMKMRPDAKVAIVGKSGSGKSTVVNLLMRYFDKIFAIVLKFLGCLLQYISSVLNPSFCFLHEMVLKFH